MEFCKVKNFINGEWVVDNEAKCTPLYNPSTGEQIGEVPLSSRSVSDAAIDAAYNAYDSWRHLSVGRRVKYLFDIRHAMETNLESLAQAIAIDQAKHISEARGEVQRVIQIFETACSIPTLIQGESLENIAPNIVGRVVKQPLGVFAGIAPFNFPALVFGWFIPFAIGTGNTFIFKPSTSSPLFMQKIGEIFQQVGLPPGVVNIVHTNRTVTESWYSHPKISGICLVGSTPTAKKIAEAAGRAGKRTMLLGGAKNYLVGMEDLQMDLFIENFLNSCYGSAGQRCLAGSVVALVESIHDQVLEKMIEASKGVTYGDAMDPNVYMGPVITAAARDKIFEYIDIGVKEGAQLLLDGRKLNLPDKNKNGYFVGPTILAGVTPDMRIAREEIFGPVVAVMKVGCIDTALKLIRQQEFGNGACIFTQNLYYSERFIAEADVGMVGVNVGICAPHPYLPFGGIKGSLIGTDKVQGKDGINFFTQNKVATVRTAPPNSPAKDSKQSGGAPAIRSCCAS
ncbi:MAG: CoA-acylating methylmalonate-semialdehyde dehydrogenase [Syntrophobacteraceae bacterium]